MSYETGTGKGGPRVTEEGVRPVTSANVTKATADVPGGRRMGRAVENGWKGERASTEVKAKD